MLSRSNWISCLEIELYANATHGIMRLHVCLWRWSARQYHTTAHFTRCLHKELLHYWKMCHWGLQKRRRKASVRWLVNVARRVKQMIRGLISSFQVLRGAKLVPTAMIINPLHFVWQVGSKLRGLALRAGNLTGEVTGSSLRLIRNLYSASRRSFSQ